MTITITADNALLAINRFISSIASDFPEPREMVSIETETKNNAEIRVYAHEELQQWINTEAGKDSMKRPKSPEAEDPLDLGTFVNCEKLFSLVLAIVEASGHLETAIKKEDDLRTFAATPGFRQALLEGRKVLESLLKAPNDLNAKMLAVGLPVNKSAGQIRLLTHTLGFKPEEFVGYKNPGRELPAYLPPLAAKTEVLIPPQAVIHFAPMPDPFSPFTPAIGADPNAAVYNEGAEIKRAMEASRQDEDAEVALAMAASLRVQALPQDEDLELALALAASLQEQKAPAEHALAMRLNQARQAYGARELKNQIETNEQFLTSLNVGIPINIANGDIQLLRVMLERIETKLAEAVFQENNQGFVDALYECQKSINTYIEGRRVIPAPAAVPQPARLPAVRNAGVGLNADGNGAANFPRAAVVDPVVAPQPAAARPVVPVPVPAAVPAMAPVATPAPGPLYIRPAPRPLPSFYRR